MQQHHVQAAQTISSAWQNRDAELLRPYLADATAWHESVGDSALTTPQAVIARWEADLAGQSDIAVSIKLLDFAGKHGYHRCQAMWRDARGIHRIDAIFAIHLDPDGKITYFMPWYENLPEPA